MTRETARRVAGRFTLAAAVIFVGAILVASGLGIGAHDGGAIWLFAAEALAALCLGLGLLTFLASFLFSRQEPRRPTLQLRRTRTAALLCSESLGLRARFAPVNRARRWAPNEAATCMFEVLGNWHLGAVTRLAFGVARHALAFVATIAAACILWTITYVALFVWAAATTGGLGGPLAYPGGLLFMAVAASICCLVLFLPATVIAEWVCRRTRFPILAQIPASTLVLAAICVPVALGLQALHEPTASVSLLKVAAFLFGLSLVPIGFYWWVSQTGPLLALAFRFISDRVSLRDGA